MSDDLVRELQDDLEKEKALLFLKKYGAYIFGFVVVVLLGIAFYNYNTKKNANLAQKEADKFFVIQQALEKNPKNDNLKDKIDTNSPYYPFLVQARYQALVKDNPEKAGKILQDYADIKSSLVGQGKDIPNFSEHILHLSALALEADNMPLADFEKKVKIYAEQKGAFKELAYEFVITKALVQKNYKMAQTYLKLLQDNKMGGTVSGRLPIYESLLAKHLPTPINKESVKKSGDKK